MCEQKIRIKGVSSFEMNDGAPFFMQIFSVVLYYIIGEFYEK